MWTCEKCGEAHQDQFKECWKCVGTEMQPLPAEAPLPSAPPPAPIQRELRSTRSMVSLLVPRVAVGFVVGMLACGAILNWRGRPLSDAIAISGVVGTVFGAVVGVFLWVAFPYEPLKTRVETADKPGESNAASADNYSEP